MAAVTDHIVKQHSKGCIDYCVVLVYISNDRVVKLWNLLWWVKRGVICIRLRISVLRHKRRQKNGNVKKTLELFLVHMLTNILSRQRK